MRLSARWPRLLLLLALLEIPQSLPGHRPGKLFPFGLVNSGSGPEARSDCNYDPDAVVVELVTPVAPGVVAPGALPAL